MKFSCCCKHTKAVIIAVFLVVFIFECVSSAQAISIKEYKENSYYFSDLTVEEGMSKSPRFATFESTYRYYGDINKDQKTNMVDIVLLQRFIVGIISFDNNQKIAGDVNADEDINMKDVVVFQKYCAQLLDELPSGILFRVN